MDKKIKKIIALGLGGLVILGGGVAIGSQFFPKTVEKVVTKEVTVTKEVPVPGPTVTVEVPKEIIKEIKVDNGNLDKVLKYVWDENGDINYLTHDLKEKEISKIVERIVLVNDFKAEAISEVKSRAFDELDGKIVNGTTLNDRKLSRLRLSDDFNEIIMKDIDFDNKDAIIHVDGTFEDDDYIKYKATFEVEFKDGQFDDLRVFSASKE